AIFADIRMHLRNNNNWLNSLTEFLDFENCTFGNAIAIVGFTIVSQVLAYGISW
ncbi:21912_t:CDS:1, partial [Dentiscutata erythropus]